ncbi:MAG: glycosyltransferase [Ignavibacterium sp.]|nr:glycosyltransferase [Ignavibacterium sp.]
MLSICIPVFNFDVRNLVDSIYSQVKNLKEKTEIILIDDCSDEYYKKINSQLPTEIRFIPLSKNIGRAKIRNLFLNYTNYDYLLFLDCDSIVIKDDFIKNYLDIIKTNPDVVIGGRIYPTEKPHKSKMLRWRYCLEREHKLFFGNNDKNNRGFLSNNFLIRKTLFEKINFDERISSYGHEDTLFGYELKKAGIKITYIDNPVLNGELEDNEVFLNKTEMSIHNLKLILEYLNFDKEFTNEVNLLRNYYLIKKLKLIFLLELLWNSTKNFVKMLLIKGYYNSLLFDFYKIGYLNSILRESDKRKPS